MNINFRCMVCRINLTRNVWSGCICWSYCGLYIFVMFLMFLQVLGSPLVAYSRILVGPFSSPGDREFLLSTFGHVGSPPRHLTVGNKTWEHVEKCGEKCGNWEISRSGEDWWLVSWSCCLSKAHRSAGRRRRHLGVFFPRLPVGVLETRFTSWKKPKNWGMTRIVRRYKKQCTGS